MIKGLNISVDGILFGLNGILGYLKIQSNRLMHVFNFTHEEIDQIVVGDNDEQLSEIVSSAKNNAKIMFLFAFR